MKKNQNEPIHTLFVGNNIQQMSNLLIFLNDNKFSVSLKKVDNTTLAKPYYKIVAPASQHDDIFNKGLLYCFSHNLDDIICGYPNLDFDSVKNIKEREIGLSK